eukprot:1011461_1
MLLVLILTVTFLWLQGAGVLNSADAPSPCPTLAPGTIVINDAELSELVEIPGVGDSIARQIIEKRPFSTWEDFKDKVTGIGDSRLQTIQDSVDPKFAVSSSCREPDADADITAPPVEPVDDHPEIQLGVPVTSQFNSAGGVSMATWNIRHLSTSRIGDDLKAIEIIAGIIQKFDVVAV